MKIITHSPSKTPCGRALKLGTAVTGFLCLALAHSGLAKPMEAKLLMTNGDRLSGTPEFNVEQQQLSLEAYYLSEPATLPLANILSIELEKSEARKLPDPYTRIQLHPRNQESAGDTLLGELRELTEDSIIVDTWYGGSITLKRSMVQSLEIINPGKGQYYGPNSLDEWESPAGDDPGSRNPESWKLEGNQLVADGHTNALIGKDIGLHQKAHLSFDLQWEKYPSFSILLYSNDVANTQPTACYKVRFDNYSASMSTFAQGRETRDNRQRLPRENFKNGGRFELFIDSETGVAQLYLNGKQACILQSANPNPAGLGTGLSFVAHTTNRISISNIKISPWSGVRGNAIDSAAGDRPDTQRDQQPHDIILLNGDKVPGTVGVIKNGRMMIKTQYTPINIPISNIQSISLGDKREEPKKYKGDVRAWFHRGGFITLRLSTIKDNKLSGYSQATGDTSIDLNAFSRVDFNIYNLDAREQRQRHFSQ